MDRRGNRSADVPLWGMENLQFNGFILEGEASSNVSAIGRLLFIALARSPNDAISIVGNLGFSGVKIVDSGPDIVRRAKNLGVQENGAKAL
jgi:hypothetical protein